MRRVCGLTVELLRRAARECSKGALHRVRLYPRVLRSLVRPSSLATPTIAPVASWLTIQPVLQSETWDQAVIDRVVCHQRQIMNQSD